MESWTDRYLVAKRETSWSGRNRLRKEISPSRKKLRRNDVRLLGGARILTRVQSRAKTQLGWYEVLHEANAAK